MISAEARTADTDAGICRDAEDCLRVAPAAEDGAGAAAATEGRRVADRRPRGGPRGGEQSPANERLRPQQSSASARLNWNFKFGRSASPSSRSGSPVRVTGRCALFCPYSLQPGLTDSDTAPSSEHVRLGHSAFLGHSTDSDTAPSSGHVRRLGAEQLVRQKPKADLTPSLPGPIPNTTPNPRLSVFGYKLPLCCLIPHLLESVFDPSLTSIEPSLTSIGTRPQITFMLLDNHDTPLAIRQSLSRLPISRM